MSLGIPPDQAWLSALEAAGPGMDPAASAAPNPNAWAGAEPELQAALAAGYGPSPASSPAPPPVVAPAPPRRAPRPETPRQFLPVDGPSPTPLGPEAPTPEQANAADLDRIAAGGAYAPPAPPVAPAKAPTPTDALGRIDALGAREDALGEERKATAKREADIAQEHARIDEEEKQQQGELAAQHHIDLLSAQADSAEQRKLAKAEEDAAIAERKNFKFQDYWADKSTGQKVLAGISVALGALGAGLNHGPNYAAEIINGAISRDFALQKARVDSMDDRVAMARTGVKDADTARAMLEREVDLRHAGALERVKSELEQKRAALGIPEAANRGDATIQAIDQEIINKRRQFELDREKVETDRAKRLIDQQRADSEALRAQATLRKAAHTGAGGPGKVKAPTEAQAKIAFLAGQMENELGTIEGLPALSSRTLDTMQKNAARATAADKLGESSVVGSVGSAVGRATGLVPKSKYDGLTPKEQQVANAWDNAVEKYARLLTGAGMPADEARRLALQNQPSAGDSPQVIKQKYDRLKLAVAQMKAEAGNAAKLVDQATATVKGPPRAAGKSDADLDSYLKTKGF